MKLVALFISMFSCLSVLMAAPGKHDNPGNDSGSSSSGSGSSTGINLGPQVVFQGFNGSFGKGASQFKNDSFFFNPVLEVNTNRGALKHSFEIPLPPTTLGFNSLRFSYNSLNQVNEGFGIGWKAGIPSLQEQSGFGKDEILLTGVGSSAIFVPVNYTLPSQKVAQEFLGLDHGSELQAFLYRPLIDGDFSIVYKFVSGSETKGYVYQTTSGISQVFGADGLVRKIVDHFGSTMHFEYQNGVLKSLYPDDSIYKLTFEGEGNREIPTSLGNIHVLLPKKFNELNLSFKNGNSKTIQFKYSDDYLNFVGYRNGVLPIFQGSYQGIQAFENEEYSLSKNINSKDNTIRTFTSPQLKSESEDAAKLYEIVTLPKNDNLITMYRDLNGDGRDERLTIDRKAKNDYLKYTVLNFPYAEDKEHKKARIPLAHRPSTFLKRLNSMTVPLKVERAIVGSGGKIVYEQDSDLSISSFPDPVQYHAYIKNGRQKGWLVEELHFESFSSGQYFVDLNGDGQKEIISCQGDYGLERKRKKVSGDDKSYLSNLALSILNIVGESGASGSEYTNIFEQSSRKPGIIYYQSYKEQPESKKVATAVGSTTFNRADAPFNCHQHSFLLDANKDGKIDILVSKSLYLGGSSGIFHKIEVSNELLSSFFEASGLVSFNGPLSIIDHDFNGKFSVFSKTVQISNQISGKLHQLVGNQAKIITPTPRYKLLSELYSPFGGRKSVKYTVKNAIPVAQKISKIPEEKHLREEREFIYQTIDKDPKSLAFTGFRKTTESVVIPGREKLQIVRNFTSDIDLEAIYFAKRGRLHGMLKNIQMKGSGAQSQFKEIKTIWLYKELDGKRVHPYKHIVHTEFLNGIDGKWVHVTDQKFEYENWSANFIPLKSRSVFLEQGNGNIPENVYDENTYLLFKSSSYVDLFNPALHLKKRQSIHSVSSNAKVIEAPTYYRYSEDLKNLLNISKGDIQTEYIYDSRGRTSLVQKLPGGLSSFHYLGSTTLPSQSEGLGKILSFEYDNLDQGHTRQISDSGITTQNAYTVDGILLESVSFSADKKSLGMKVTPPSQIKCSESEMGICLEKSLFVHEYGVDKQIELNSFGHAVQEIFDISGKKYFSAKSEFNSKKDLLTTVSAKFEEAKQNDIEATYLYDHSGRPTYSYKRAMDKPSEKLPLNKHIYTGLCRYSRPFDSFNDKAFEKVCKNTLGTPLYSQLGDERVVIESNYLGEITKVGDIEYAYDKNNMLSFTKSDDPKLGIYNEEFFKTSIQSNSVRKVYPHGEVAIFDQYLRPKSTSNTGLDFKFEYDKDLLSSVSMTDYFSGDEFGIFYSYDTLERLSLISAGIYSKELRYDDYGQVHGEKVQFGDHKLDLTYEYSAGLLVGGNLVTNIEYQKDLFLKKVSFANSHSMEIERDPIFGDILSIRYLRGEKNIFQRVIEKDHHRKTIKRSDSLLGGAHLENHFSYDNHPFHLDYSKKTVQRDSSGNLQSHKGLQVKYARNLPVQITKSGSKIVNYFDLSGGFLGGCPKGVSLSVDSKSCFVVLGDGEILVKSHHLKLVRHLGLPLALYINSVPFIPLSDELGSVVGLVDPKQGKVLFYREFSAHGKKEVSYPEGKDYLVGALGIGAEKLEQLVAFSFALLLENPLLTKSSQPLYHSKSRIYSSYAKQWLTVDPLVKYNPTKIAMTPGNWDSTRYAGGDPLGFVDPSGHCAGCDPGIAKVDRNRIIDHSSAKPTPGNMMAGEHPWDGSDRMLGVAAKTFIGIGLGKILGNLLGLNKLTMKPLKNATGKKNGWTLSKGNSYGSKPRLDYQQLPSAGKGAKGLANFAKGKKLLHYHRRGNGGIGLHRPWQTKDSWGWKGLWKRF